MGYGKEFHVIIKKIGDVRFSWTNKIQIILVRIMIRSFRHCMLAAFLVAFYILFFSFAFAADDPVALRIMEQVDGRDDGDNIIADMEMVLIDKHGQQRHRLLRSYTKDKGKDTLRLLFFLKPAEVKDTGFLTWDYADSSREDDQWLYLPFLRKTKRIASSDKSNSFMGSDFTYADMTKFVLDDYDYKLQEESMVGRDKVWVIWAIPKNKRVIEETGYLKSLLLVRQDNYVVIRGVHWLEKKGEVKYMDVKKIERIEGIWIGTEVSMVTKLGKKMHHKTILRLHNVKFNQDLSEGFFSVRQLEKGG